MLSVLCPTTMNSFMSTATIQSLREVGKDLSLDMCPDDSGSRTSRSTNHRPWTRFFVDQLCCSNYAESQIFAEMEQERGGRGRGRGHVRGSSIPSIPDLQLTPPSSIDEDDDDDDDEPPHCKSTSTSTNVVCLDDDAASAKDEASQSTVDTVVAAEDIPPPAPTPPPSPPPPKDGRRPSEQRTAQSQSATSVGSYHVYSPERMSPPPEHGPRIEIRAPPTTTTQKEPAIISIARRPSFCSGDAGSLGDSVDDESYSRRRRLLLAVRAPRIEAEAEASIEDDDDDCTFGSATLPLDDSSYWSASAASLERGTATTNPRRRVRWSPGTAERHFTPAARESSSSRRSGGGRPKKWHRMKSWAAGGGGGGEMRGRKLSRDRARPPLTIVSKSLPDATYIGMTEGYECGGGGTTMCEV